eukprot:TRINITY_DN29000_c0_g1_i1.p1 TRINITY_DN29000_c0_g1~~TRINITY_DN29000_c0_g1_i1.p1  ORF type:complete len:231 (-),score=48.57 TRINITY_DN29000_c0_g1_i1:569-1261(-)
MASTFVGSFLASSRASRRRPLRLLALVVAAVAAAGSFSWCTTFATTIRLAAKPAAPVVDDPAVDQAEEFEEGPDGKKRRKKKDKDDFLQNITLLGDGFPGTLGPNVGQGPPWATCFADVEQKSTDQVDGTVTRSNVLEQWIMRGDRSNTDAFIAWRQRMAHGPVSVRCSNTNLKDAEDVVCLECVSHVGGLPFTADSPIVPSGFIVSDFQQCMRRSFDGTGFCKSASLVL